jgi:ABC-type multidrug transport system permease subunit
VRNKINLIMRFAVAGVMGALFACIFQGIGGKDETPAGMQSHFGAVCNLMISGMFGALQPILLQFPFERPVFLREYASGMYGSVPYFLAKTIVEIFVTIITSIETYLIAYWIMDLQGNFFCLILVSFSLSMTAASTGLFVGCSVANAQSAQEIAPLCFVPQILFSGIFITNSLIPKWMRWLQYVCALKYAINLGCIVEFANQPFNDEFLSHFDIHREKTWLYIGIMAALFVGFRVAAMLNLRRKAAFVF